MDEQRLGWISDSPEQKRQYKEQLHAEMAQQVEEQAVRAASATLQESSVRDTPQVLPMSIAPSDVGGRGECHVIPAVTKDATKIQHGCLRLYPYYP